MVDTAISPGQPRPTQQSGGREDAPHPTPIEYSLAPTDRGLAAWRLLCTAFVFEALLWGKTFRDYITGQVVIGLTAHFRISALIRGFPEPLL